MFIAYFQYFFSTWKSRYIYIKDGVYIFVSNLRGSIEFSLGEIWVFFTWMYIFLLPINCFTKIFYFVVVRNDLEINSSKCRNIGEYSYKPKYWALKPNIEGCTFETGFKTTISKICVKIQI